MKQILLIFALLFAAASSTDPVLRHADGSVTIDTSTLRTRDGYNGPTPLLIYLDSDERISKIEVLPNDESPAYWQMVEEKLSTAWNGVPADQVRTFRVDAVSGATFSSYAFISNVRAGIACYLDSKQQ